MMHKITYAPEPDEGLSAPWIFSVIGWNWDKGKPILEAIPRDLQASAVSVEVPPGTILCFGRKRLIRRHYSKFHYSIVTVTGGQIFLEKHQVLGYFRNGL